MSTLTRINSKTWITKKSTEKLNDYRRKLNTCSIIGVGAKDNEKLPKVISNSREKDYLDFLKNAFSDKSFMSEKVFNRLLKETFNNSTWYRKRMINMGLITSNNGIIKYVNLNSTENTEN